MVGEAAKRGPFLVLLVMLMILLRTSTHCGATTSITNDFATSPYHGRMDDEPDWMFDSEISRILIGKDQLVYNTANANQKAVPCGKDQRYGKCLQKPNDDPRRRQKCSDYNRDLKNCPQ